MVLRKNSRPKGIFEAKVRIGYCAEPNCTHWIKYLVRFVNPNQLNKKGK